MIRNLQLVAMMQARPTPTVRSLPMTRELQQALEQILSEQYDTFAQCINERPFDPGYNPSDDECFAIDDYQLPACLQLGRESTCALDRLGGSVDDLSKVKALVGYAQDDDEEEVLVFQKVSQSHIVRPSSFLFIERDTFTSFNHAALSIGNKLDATYHRGSAKLRFSNYRNANAFLPLADCYREASERDICEILSHRRIRAENPQALANGASQWLRTRFAMLRDSGVLENYTPESLCDRAATVGLTLRVEGTGDNSQIVFPADKSDAKTLLQFLNEEIYKGPVTEFIYETNSKTKVERSA